MESGKKKQIINSTKNRLLKTLLSSRKEEQKGQPPLICHKFPFLSKNYTIDQQNNDRNQNLRPSYDATTIIAPYLFLKFQQIDSKSKKLTSIKI